LRRLWLVAAALVWGLAVGAAGLGRLRVSPYAVKVDGDPREAFLLGARPLPMSDAVTGRPDGSVRAYVLATREGLYVAVLSTEPDGGRGLLRPLPWAPPQEWVLGDWMAVRLGEGAGTRLFLMVPGAMKTVLDGEGLPVEGPPPWRAAESVFGRTWAGEWLIPWASVPREREGRFCLEVLRGRKVRADGVVQESLSQSSPGPASWRWGGRGLSFAVPSRFPEAATEPRALKPYDVRPYIPAGQGAREAHSAAPAGQEVTAWLEVPPGEGTVSVSVSPGLEEVRASRLDFWWQAGRREEIDALFPVRVAAGMGDVLVGERLFPEPKEGFQPDGMPQRFVVKGRVPAGAKPGTLLVPIRIERGGHVLGEIPWKVKVAPALPPPSRLVGAYYLDPKESHWGPDLRDLAEHGLTAVTCPARDGAGWRRFQEEAERAGLDGRWALHPDAVPAGEEAWAYVADEPATVEAIGRARPRALAAKARGLKPWAALAWPNSLGLATVLDGVAVPPNLAGQARRLASSRRWLYVQGLRENPFYNRVWAGLLARAPGVDGLWVFCYAPAGDGGADDWAGPMIRYDALVDPDGKGGRLDTVQFEALRAGIVDGRLLDALGPARARAVLARFPGALEALRGEYWRARDRGWSFPELRQALVAAWARP